MKKHQIYLLSAMSGILLTLSFPPFPMPLFAFIAFIPLLTVIEQRKGERIFLPMYFTFFVFQLGANWWIGSWQSDADPFLMLAGTVLVFVHPFFFLVPMYAYLSIRRKFGHSAALWLFPSLWISFEWLHSIGDLAYPWLSIGNSQVYNIYWAQAADIAGVWGLSFLIVFINILIIKIMYLIKDKSQDVDRKKVVMLLISTFLMIFLPYVYGFYRISDFDNDLLQKENKKISIGVVQPNINPWLKWQSNVISQIRKHFDLQDSLLNVKGRLDLIIWSETAIPFVDFNFNSTHNFRILNSWVDRNNTSLLTGFVDIQLYKKGEANSVTAKRLNKDSEIFYDSYNSALLLNPKPYDSLNPQIYHKSRLTPFSEQFPFNEVLSFAKGWFEWGVGISSWKKGESQLPMILQNADDSISIGTIICIESIYPDFTRNYILQGAEVLVIITNDAWYDNTFGPEQHFAIAQMRAIESRRYIMRCANSGISGVIAASGRRIFTANQYETLAFAGTLPLIHEQSLYVHLGDWLPITSTILSLLWIFYGFFRKNVST